MDAIFSHYIGDKLFFQRSLLYSIIEPNLSYMQIAPASFATESSLNCLKVFCVTKLKKNIKFK
jgi:hypothetical protein